MNQDVVIQQISMCVRVECRLMAGMWCRLALHCGEQRQQPTLERRRLPRKKHARGHCFLLRRGAAQGASKCVGTSGFGATAASAELSVAAHL